jgi:hypothetical protein
LLDSFYGSYLVFLCPPFVMDSWKESGL